MKLVFSSFVIGLGASAYGTLLVTEGLRTRKQFMDPKFDEDEFRAFLYQSELNYKVNEKKFQGDNWFSYYTRKAVNQFIVPNVRQGVNTLSTLPLADLTSSVLNRGKEFVNDLTATAKSSETLDAPAASGAEEKK